MTFMTHLLYLCHNWVIVLFLPIFVFIVTCLNIRCQMLMRISGVSCFKDANV